LLNGTHKKLANLLLASHKTKSANMRLPQYSYEDLKKGPTCAICDSFSLSIVGSRMVCRDCGFEEKVDEAVMRIVREIMVLFPEMRITTGLVWEWCDGVVSKKTISRVLKRELQQVGYGQWTYYIQKN
jgi:hypothetical protein